MPDAVRLSSISDLFQVAPEVIELKGASTASDIWSLGCTIVELLTGRPPYGEIANSMSGTDTNMKSGSLLRAHDQFYSHVSHRRR